MPEGVRKKIKSGGRFLAGTSTVRSEVASQTRPKRSPKPRSRVGGAAVRGSIAVGPALCKRARPAALFRRLLVLLGLQYMASDSHSRSTHLQGLFFFESVSPRVVPIFENSEIHFGGTVWKSSCAKGATRLLTSFCGTFRIQWLYAVGCGELRGGNWPKRPIFGRLVQRTKNLSAARLFWPRSGRGAKRRNGLWFCVR